MSGPEDAAKLQASFASVVRALGLLRPDATPCGQPMSVSEAHAISELHAAGCLTQQSLADHLRLQKRTVSRLVDELCANGLVKRGRNPVDRRGVLLELTSLGNRQAARRRVLQPRAKRCSVGYSIGSRPRSVVVGLDRLARAANAG